MEVVDGCHGNLAHACFSFVEYDTLSQIQNIIWEKN
jgi:hypothetical protein